MNFRTEIEIEPCASKIEHNQKILTIGSCFAENIAEQFKFYLFDVFENPFGVLYNPVSIYNALEITSGEKVFSKEDLIYDNGEWHSLFHHSDFSHYDADECLKKINARTPEVKEYLLFCSWVIISLGTSFVYRHKKKNLIVSNCHRIPASEFERILLPVDTVFDYLNRIDGLLKSINPQLNILYTVSPVRHIKDGFEGNQVSKSSLIIALRNLLKENKKSFYFPSYEIMMDDLRDYRFYEKDMLHPNKIAVEYIWERFSRFCFSGECMETIKDIEPYSRARNHRLMNPDSPNSKKFLESISEKKTYLQKKYPHVNLK